MENILANTSILLPAALIIFLFIILLIVLCLSGAKQRKTIRKIENLQDEVSRLQKAQEQTAARAHDDLIRNLQQLNESLLSAYGQMNRSQAEQVNAVIQQSYENVHSLQRIIDENMQRSEMRVEALRKTMDENMRLMREENAKKLNEMRMTVDEKLNETLEKRLTSSFSQVSERLEQVYRSLGEVHSLASGVGDLKRMLSNVKTRGVWGEIQLGALLEQALTESQYDVNVAVVPGSSERVEFAVRLPGRDGSERPVYLPIDSKFPQEDYARLAEASQSGDVAAVDAAQKALLSAIKTEAKRIGKYIAPPYTTDFAVMFLPLEGLYAEVVKHSELVEALQREHRVLISGPSTLLALLNSLQMGFRTLAIEQRSAEVWKLLGAVKTDFGSFGVLLKKTQDKLLQASDSIETAFAKTRSIERRLRKVEAIETPEAEKLLEDE